MYMKITAWITRELESGELRSEEEVQVVLVGVLRTLTHRKQKLSMVQTQVYGMPP